MEGCMTDSPRAQTTCFHHRPRSSVTCASAGNPGPGQCCCAITSCSVHSPVTSRWTCRYCFCVVKKSIVRKHRSLLQALRLLTLSRHRLAKRLVVRKRIVIFLAIVLNTVLTRGSAIHRVRHNHFRRDLPSPFQRCDVPVPSKEAAAAGGWCSQSQSHNRQRRSAQWALELRQTIGKTLCPFAVCEDRDANRRPQSIHKIMCLEAGCRCTEPSYRCVQVFDEVEVIYLNDQGNRANETWVSKRIKVEVGCMCAANVAQAGSTSFPNSLDD